MTPLLQVILRLSLNKKGRNVFVIFIGKTVMPGQPPGMFVFWCFRGGKKRGLFLGRFWASCFGLIDHLALPSCWAPAGLPCACAGLPCAFFVWMCREIERMKLGLAVAAMPTHYWSHGGNPLPKLNPTSK